jgi:membrane protein implicated in regulation of membrane protease activity
MSEMMILWIGILIAAIVIETMTMGLTSIWFSGGALAAVIVELLNGSIAIQVIVFLVISLILLFYTRPIAVKHFNQKREKTNLDSVIGKTAVVTIPIHNLKETGQVMLEGKEWTARSTDSSKQIEKDALVKVVAIRGVKLMVEEA